MKNILVSAAFAAAMTAATAASASTTPITGGSTSVTVTADLDALGLMGATTGTATVDILAGLPVFTFGITGGSVNARGNAVIEHDGSGVALSAGTVSATVGDFLIDTAAETVTGTVNGALFGVELFTFGSVGADGVQLLISNDLGAALFDTFGAAGLAGAEFGFAVPAPQLAAVPLPAGGFLLLTALGGVAIARRRKAA